MEFSRPEYWSGKPFPSLGDLSNPGIKPKSPALQADSLLGEPYKYIINVKYYYRCCYHSVQFSRSVVSDSATPWIAAHQASLSITNSWSSPKLMCIESVMPSSHLILCHPLLLLPSIPPSIRIFSNESILRMKWPKYWSFSLSISPSNEYPRLISFRMAWLDLLAVQGTLKNLF